MTALSKAPSLVSEGFDSAVRGRTNRTSRRPRRKITRRAAKRLLRQIEHLERQLTDFCGGIGDLIISLDEILPDSEIEAMDTPEANVLGTLECLLVDDLKPALRKLQELGSLFK